MVPTARQNHILCARGPDPDMRNIPSALPVKRDRMGARRSYPTHTGLSWAALSVAMEGGAAKAAAEPEAAAEPPIAPDQDVY